jgi:hypothetical protein
MKKVLLVGYNYAYENEVVKKYQDVLFIPAHEIKDVTPERLIELVKAMDAVLLMNGTDTTYEVAAILLNKDVYLPDDSYPVDIEDEEEVI